MLFKQFYDDYLSQASYLIGCQSTGEAMIIDPIRDLTKYIEVADSEGFKITHVIETHIHADFASGIRDVAKYLKANIYVSGAGHDQLSYKNMPNQTHFVKHQDVIYVGNIKLEVLHTPGHTPESISLLLTDKGGKSSIPMGLFSGDFIFVGDVGRPDLLEKTGQNKRYTEISAAQMYQSINSIKNLPSYIQIWPGHGAGSACGKALGAVPMSTLGYEKVNNWAFIETDEAAFIETLTSNQPATPYYFTHMKKINQHGMNLYQPYHVCLGQGSDRIAFDLRSNDAYHAGHAYGTINIPYNKNFLNQIGWYLDFAKDIDLIGDEVIVEKASQTLQLIGFDNVSSYCLPKPEVSTQYIHSNDLTGQEAHVLDVRTHEEWNAGHLSQSVNIPHGELLNENIPFNKEDKIYVYCQSGVRSSIAIGILENRGFKNVINIKEGYLKFPESLK